MQVVVQVVKVVKVFPVLVVLEVLEGLVALIVLHLPYLIISNIYYVFVFIYSIFKCFNFTLLLFFIVSSRLNVTCKRFHKSNQRKRLGSPFSFEIPLSSQIPIRFGIPDEPP